MSAECQGPDIFQQSFPNDFFIHDKKYEKGNDVLRGPCQYSPRQRYSMERRNGLERTTVSRTPASNCWILLFHLHLNEAKFGFEKLQYNLTFICWFCFWSTSRCFHLYKANIQNWLIYQENLSYFLTGSKYLFQIKAEAEQIRWYPAKSGNRMQKSHG